MMSIQAILFDLGNTLMATASLAGALADLRNSSLAQELKLDGQQLLNLGEEIERSIGNLYAENTLLNDKGLAAFFDVIVWSNAVNYRKPDARIFQFALDRLNLKPGKQIVMVGDNEQADITGGKAMGFTTVKVTKSNQETHSAAEYVVTGSELMKLFQTTLKSQRSS